MRHEGKTEARLGRIRGSEPPRRHNARTIAALTSNPGCARRAVLDAAGVDKERLAERVDFPAAFGQSRFAIVRGNAFERQVKADGCAELLRLLQDVLGLDLRDAAYTDLGAADSADGLAARHVAARERLADAPGDEGGVYGALFDHPLLRLEVAGQDVYLEPDLVAFQHGGAFHVVEIKSFPVIDGQADGEKVAAAAVQSAVYVLALRRLLGRDDAVSHEVVLVCPKDFSNVPVAVRLDVRRQLIVLEHQLARLTRIDTLLDALPDDLALDLGHDGAGAPVMAAGALTAALGQVTARYAPGCLSTCELAFFCRREASGRTAALGVGVREELGGVETVDEALGLAHGTATPDDDLAESAAMLRTTARVYAEALGSVPGMPRVPGAPGTPGGEAGAGDLAEAGGDAE
ncbi:MULTISPECIES: hypothetical protein [Pseudofrankia]|uniref:hypothetical protein n=1 Tax=Pseudofrankia TaxID=2994363 RepID=UPI000234C305|nr:MULTISPECIES: hypothetical protein [Pseudofrankia]OHV37101.1 hypothetical protein BCD49_18105 [Pseudofrankia sp. EUN1h]